MPIEEVTLGRRYMDRLQLEAERRGMTLEDLAAELMNKELAERTKLPVSRGTVASFRRKA